MYCTKQVTPDLVWVGSNDVLYCHDKAHWSKPLVYEVAIPFAALGLKPAPGVKIPFNAHVHNGEFGEDRWWEPPCPLPDGSPAPAPCLVLKD